MRQVRSGLLFVVSGPSGSGKTTLVREVLKRGALKSKISRSISLTTRPKRSGERQGRDYFFVSPEAFKKLLRGQKILEWTRYLGYYYGTPREFVDKKLARGKHLVLCLDLRGAQKIARIYPRNTVKIFVLPPSLKVLKQRIARRCQHTTPEEISERLRRARKEILAAGGYQSRIVNIRLERSVLALERIILHRIAKI